MNALTTGWIEAFFTLIFKPKPRYSDSWKPAFLAMQLGFIAGAVGPIARGLFLSPPRMIGVPFFRLMEPVIA